VLALMEQVYQHLEAPDFELHLKKVEITVFCSK
jgi:hypothetical protein